MRLIGLNGRREAGKDTAFAAIKTYAEQNNQVAVRKAFADPLKISGMRALGFNGLTERQALDLANILKETGQITISWSEPSKFVDEETRFETTIYGRHFFQWYGTESHRANDLGHSFGENFWIDNLLPFKGWELSFRNADYGVVTDVRFPNEAERILQLGGVILEIDADTRIAKARDKHASEQPLPRDLITATIDNNGTLDDLAKNVRNYLKS